jgi:hypothetical protein
MWLDVPGDLPLRLCSRIAAHAQALLASLGYARFQDHGGLILTAKQTDDARVDKPMFALIFTNENVNIHGLLQSNDRSLHADPPHPIDTMGQFDDELVYAREIQPRNTVCIEAQEVQWQVGGVAN